jgi:hypothetical protein
MLAAFVIGPIVLGLCYIHILRLFYTAGQQDDQLGIIPPIIDPISRPQWIRSSDTPLPTDFESPLLPAFSRVIAAVILTAAVPLTPLKNFANGFLPDSFS